jgi:hypothetical protein
MPISSLNKAGSISENQLAFRIQKNKSSNAINEFKNTLNTYNYFNAIVYSNLSKGDIIEIDLNGKAKITTAGANGIIMESVQTGENAKIQIAGSFTFDSNLFTGHVGENVNIINGVISFLEPSANDFIQSIGVAISENTLLLKLGMICEVG